MVASTARHSFVGSNARFGQQSASYFVAVVAAAAVAVAVDDVVVVDDEVVEHGRDYVVGVLFLAVEFQN